MNAIHTGKDGRVLELRHLRTLTAIAELGTLVKAAERLHVTQSALSHQIRQLETHYGMPLFERSARTLRASAAGERLLQLANRVLAEVRAADQELAVLRDGAGTTFRAALECHTCFDWLTPVLGRFRERWPAVEVDLVAGFHPDPVRLLKSGKADIVIGSDLNDTRGLTKIPLFRFEIMAVLPPGHALAGRKWLRPEDFRDETLITYPVPEKRIDLIREFLTPAGVAPRRRTTELTVAIVQLVASSRGLAALPDWGIRNYVDYGHVISRRIGRHGLWSNLYVIAPDKLAATAPIRDFAEIARASCFSTLTSIVPVTRRGR
jgi:LysR family transcriptional regulator for metE and metH